MKKTFESRYSKDTEFYDALLSNATIVLDTNVLLSLYRFSEPTRDYFIDILSRIKDRLWLPFQVGNEFFTNRLTVVRDQIQSYTDFEKSLYAVQTKLDEKRSHPFLTEDTLSKLNNALTEVYADLSNSKEKYEDLINNDIILKKLLDIYEGKAGQELPLEKIDEIIKIAKDRYSKKIPPGYMDFKPKGGDNSDENLSTYDKVRPYGDYFLWWQTINYAKDKTNIILVTDDTKEDWYVKSMGKTIGPRHELIAEFKSETNREIHLYQSDIFIKRIESNLGMKANSAAIEEIKESNSQVSNREIIFGDKFIERFANIEEDQDSANENLNATINDLDEIIFESTTSHDESNYKKASVRPQTIHLGISKVKLEIESLQRRINVLKNMSKRIQARDFSNKIEILEQDKKEAEGKLKMLSLYLK